MGIRTVLKAECRRKSGGCRTAILKKNCVSKGLSCRGAEPRLLVERPQNVYSAKSYAKTMQVCFPGNIKYEVAFDKR